MGTFSSFAAARLLLLLVIAVSALRAQAPATPAAPGEALTPEQQILFKELEVKFDALEAFLAGLPESQPRIETRRVLGEMKQRAAGLRRKFDQGLYDEIRWEVNFEHQQMALWLRPARTRSPAEVERGPHNALIPEESATGWELLFDGRSLAGWRGFRGSGIPAGRWTVEDGLIHARPMQRVPGDRLGDIITERKFDNFEFSWEWRIAAGANSGVKYLVTEERPNTPGPEYQMIDDLAGLEAASRRVHQTAAFYDVLPPSADVPRRPAGQWNRSSILVKGNHVEHWLNDTKVLSFDLGSPAVKAGLAASKFKDESGFGAKITGHIMLTYHGDEAWFRNLKIRELK
jgi:hypothetical protein